MEAEHINNVGEFRAVRDISLRRIVLQHKDEPDDEEEMELSPLPSKPQGAAGSHQTVHPSSSSDSHSATIKSLHVNHSPRTHTPVANHCCSVEIENYPTKILTAATNRLELTAVDPHAARTKVKNSTENLTKAADEIELLAANQHDVEADPQELEMVTDSVM